MPTGYFHFKKVKIIPRLPHEAEIDLTYRCNNNCLHCWLRLPVGAKEAKQELTLEGIKDIVGQAKEMGCRSWSISGGEPMLRPDFAEIFDYITRNTAFYSLNTNGALITPKIAKLMKRKGFKMVALYGATAKVHDHITQNTGSFIATMQGFAYLKEARARFTVQIIPLKDNYHQFQEMVNLAKTLSRDTRIGATWLYLSASGDEKTNQRIMQQRLPAKEAVKLDKPNLAYEDWMNKEKGCCQENFTKNGYSLASCIATRRKFHIDPYGQSTFCSFIKEPSLRYDLKKGSFKEFWKEFIPSLANKFRVSNKYEKNCGVCGLKEHCRFCPAHTYLERRRLNPQSDYLCEITRENKKFKDNWFKNHRRYYRIADITLQVDSDLPMHNNTFEPMFKLFRVNGPGEDTITIRHHFLLPDLDRQNLGREVYRKNPWAIYKKGDFWIYLGISAIPGNRSIRQVLVIKGDYTSACIYNSTQIQDEHFLKGNSHSLTLTPTDQIILAPALADREGFYLHSCGVIFKGKGLVFVGHSDAGKSTIANMLKDKAELLCDERIIIKKYAEGFRIHGTWCHGDVPEVSPNSAPLKAIMLLNKSNRNSLELINNRNQINKMLLAYLIRPLVTAKWWDKMLILTEKITNEIPCYSLYFDKDTEIDWLLEKFL